jgi:hypothetical protein
MIIESKNGSEWILDEGLRTVARDLLIEFTNEVGHVDLTKVAFVRVSDPNAKWLGKCWYIAPPKNMLTWYAYMALKKNQIIVEDFDETAEHTQFLDDLLDIHYVIALNNAPLERFDAGETGLREKQEKYVLLHELYHVKPTQDGIRKHDVEDFADILRKVGIDWTSGIYDGSDEDEHS